MTDIPRLAAARVIEKVLALARAELACPACGDEGGYIVLDDMGDECRHGHCRTCGKGRPS